MTTSGGSRRTRAGASQSAAGKYDVIPGFTYQNHPGIGWGILIFFGVITLFPIPPLGLLAITVGIFAAVNQSRKPKSRAINAYNKGLKLYSKGQQGDAIDALEEAVSMDPENVKAHELLCLIYHDNLDDYRKAAEHAEAILNVSPDHLVALFTLADSQYELRNYGRAIDNANRIPKDSPIEDYRVVLIGKCHYQRREYDIAAEYLKNGPARRRNMDSNVLAAKYWLGLSYLGLGEKQKAKTQLLRVYTEDPDYEDVAKHVKAMGWTAQPE